MLFTCWEVRTGKIFCRGVKNGPRPKVEGRFSDRDKITRGNFVLDQSAHLFTVWPLSQSECVNREFCKHT